MGDNELTTQPPETGPADIRDAIMTADPETISQGLAMYSEKRLAFRTWLEGHLKEGVHYGFPPGCRRSTANEKEWISKPSLYKAGADLVCDLMQVRVEYATDMDAWKQLGEPVGTYVFRCMLKSRTTGELIAEGRGVRKVGEKGMKENASIKMAQKAAKVDAVLNGWGLSDLFTQDLEDMAKEEAAQPEHNANAPQVKGRGERVSGDELKHLHATWAADNPDAKSVDGAFRLWVQAVSGVKADDCGNPDVWSKDQLNQCYANLDEVKRNG